MALLVLLAFIFLAWVAFKGELDGPKIKPKHSETEKPQAAATQAKTSGKIEDSQEFQERLQRAREIKAFFETAIGNKGNVMVVKCDIDHPEELDYSREKYSELVYFRVYLDYGYGKEVEAMLRSNRSQEENIAFINGYLKEHYGKTMEEVTAFGLDPYDVVYDTKACDDDCDSVLYYKFLCPCGLKGDARDRFIKEI